MFILLILNTILMLIAGIVMSTMVASQVAPNIIDQIKVKKTQVQTINNQDDFSSSQIGELI